MFQQSIFGGKLLNLGVHHKNLVVTWENCQPQNRHSVCPLVVMVSGFSCFLGLFQVIQGQTVKLQGFKGVLSGKRVPGIWWAPPKQMLFSLAPSIPSAAGCLRLKKRGVWCFFRVCFFLCVFFSLKLESLFKNQQNFILLLGSFRVFPGCEINR